MVDISKLSGSVSQEDLTQALNDIEVLMETEGLLSWEESKFIDELEKQIQDSEFATESQIERLSNLVNSFS